MNVEVVKLWKDEETRKLVDQAMATIFDKIKHIPTEALGIIQRQVEQELQDR